MNSFRGIYVKFCNHPNSEKTLTRWAGMKRGYAEKKISLQQHIHDKENRSVRSNSKKSMKKWANASMGCWTMMKNDKYFRKNLSSWPLQQDSEWPEFFWNVYTKCASYVKIPPPIGYDFWFLRTIFSCFEAARNHIATWW